MKHLATIQAQKRLWPQIHVHLNRDHVAISSNVIIRNSNTYAVILVRSTAHHSRNPDHDTLQERINEAYTTLLRSVYTAKKNYRISSAGKSPVRAKDNISVETLLDPKSVTTCNYCFNFTAKDLACHHCLHLNQ